MVLVCLVKGKIVMLSDIIKNGGRLDPKFYIDNDIGEDIK